MKRRVCAARAPRRAARARIRRGWAAQFRWAPVWWALWGASWCVGFAAPAVAQEQSRHFDIVAQPLSASLLDFARQAGLEIFLPEASLGGREGRPVRGMMSSEAALELLLDGSGFRGRIVEGAVRLTRAGAQAPAPPWRAPAPAHSQEVVVTGRSLRVTYPDAYPVGVYSAEELKRAGVVRVEQFVGALTQNLASRVRYGAGSTSVANSEAVNAIDLRGLGVGASLVLVNGRRLPLASEGRTADISFLPMNAIERIEVLSDTAPVRFGADAVGGVVNFVLREDISAPQTRIDYGAVTEGGLREGGVSHAQGARFAQGSAFGAVSYRSASALARTDRDFAAGAGPGDLSPHEERLSFVGQLNHTPFRGLVLSGDVLAGERNVKTGYALPDLGVQLDASSQSSHWLFGASAAVSLPQAYALHFDLTRAAYATRMDQIARSPAGVARAAPGADYDVLDVSAMLTRRFGAPNGEPVRVALGLGRLNEDFSSRLSAYAAERSSSYAFAELEAPLVGDSQGAPLVRRLDLSLGARWTAYEDEGAHDFGERIIPRVGVSWALSEALRVRASYGEAFRAPALIDLDPSGAFNALVPASLQGEIVSVLGVFGPGPLLEAEHARTFTAGFDLEAVRALGFSARATYFRVAYDGRVGVADSTAGLAAFADPGRFADILYASDDVQLIASILAHSSNAINLLEVDLSAPDAAEQLAALHNLVIFDNRLRNLESVKVEGVDLDFAFAHEFGFGRISAGARMSKLFAYDERTTPNAPEVSVLNTVLRPVDLRARAFVGFERGGLDVMGAFNYVAPYANPYGVGGASVSAWRTWDLRVGYDFARPPGHGDGIGLALVLNNVFDEPPPFTATSGPQGEALHSAVGFDPANANPVGRFVSIEITRRW